MKNKKQSVTKFSQAFKHIFRGMHKEKTSKGSFERNFKRGFIK